jgi:Lanthionine synthetase C-like protein
MKLWSAEMFEPLTDEPWDETRVRAGIQAIADDAEANYDPDSLWPAADWDLWQTPPPLKSLYVGASGVIWALDVLRRRGQADVGLDLASAALRTLELWREQPDFMQGEELPDPPESSLLCGEAGPLLVAWRLAPSAELADELHARVVANIENDAVEIMWGSPGTMLAAREMHEWTGEQRWADAWQASADELTRRRDDEGLWTKRLYGEESRGLSPPHGVVGNVLALLAGGPNEALERETADVLARHAVLDDGLANWPNRPGPSLEGQDGVIRVQWCAGAPGIVISASGYLDEELLLAGAELAWRAGPHGMEKGPCICHGTAGNGYSFLKTFERTGDEQWLDRARRFAVHALGQVQRRRDEQGHGRFSLWTGDAGVALYAADCIDARARYPVMDSLSD